MKKQVTVVALALGLSLMGSAATAQESSLLGATAVSGEHLVPERSVFANTDTFLLEYDTMVVSNYRKHIRTRGTAE